MDRLISHQVELFNGPLETGVRSAIILQALNPKAYDLTHLTWFDHLVVHTGDLNGPKSLHPDIPQRNGELLVRRRRIEGGIDLMKKLHIIEENYTADGILYTTSEDAAPFVQLVRSTYGKKLKERAKWLSHYLHSIKSDDLEKVITEKVGRWNIEFNEKT